MDMDNGIDSWAMAAKGCEKIKTNNP